MFFPRSGAPGRTCRPLQLRQAIDGRTGGIGRHRGGRGPGPVVGFDQSEMLDFMMIYVGLIYDF